MPVAYTRSSATKLASGARTVSGSDASWNPVSATEDPAEPLGQDVVGKQTADLGRDEAVECAGGLHLDEPAADQLAAKRLVIVSQQFLRGHGTKLDHRRAR